MDTQLRRTVHVGVLTEVEENVEEWHKEGATADACCSSHRSNLQDTGTSAHLQASILLHTHVVATPLID